MQKNNHEETTTGKIEVRTSTISGKGSFAKEKIICGEYITTLTGLTVVSSPNVQKICLIHDVSADDPLQIEDKKFLILNYSSKTINHSCNPNTGIRNKSDLYAINDIDINEEITYDYSTTSGTNDTWVMPCSCKANNCRKKIGNVLTIPSFRLIQYALQNCLPDFVKQQLLLLTL